MFLLPTLATSPQTDFVGTWTGSVTIHGPGGQDEHGAAILWIGSRPNRLVGSIGEDGTHQTALRDLRQDGSKLTFQFDVHEGVPVSVTLTQSNGQITGNAVGPVNIDFELRPAKGVQTLFQTVSDLDAKLFDAYNRRDLKTMEPMFSKDLEFFHDKDGLTGYQANIASFRKLMQEQTRYRRELENGSVEVYPVKDYGAMEIGVHRFYAKAMGKPEQLVATAKFVHIWANRHGHWQISRVVSYDHH